MTNTELSKPNPESIKAAKKYFGRLGFTYRIMADSITQSKRFIEQERASRIYLEHLNTLIRHNAMRRNQITDKEDRTTKK